MKRTNLTIKTEIIKSGLTLREVAEEIGYNPCSLSRLLSGKITKEKREMIMDGLERLRKKKEGET